MEAAAPWDPQSVLPFMLAWGSATNGMAGAGLAIAALQSMVRYWMPNTPHVFESFTSLSRAHCDHKVQPRIRAASNMRPDDPFSDHSAISIQRFKEHLQVLKSVGT